MKFIVERAFEGEAEKRYLCGCAWVQNKADADRMTFEDADRVAQYWQDYSAHSGKGYLFNVVEVSQ